MKKKLMASYFGFVALTCVAFASGVSYANAAKEDKKATVAVTQDKSVVSIAITHDPTYKWNELYPATLKFSVCSDLECVMYTEKIIITK